MVFVYNIFTKISNLRLKKYTHLLICLDVSNLENPNAKAFVKSRKPDKKAINIKFIGKINPKFTPFFRGKYIPLKNT